MDFLVGDTNSGPIVTLRAALRQIIASNSRSRLKINYFFPLDSRNQCEDIGPQLVQGLGALGIYWFTFSQFHFSSDLSELVRGRVAVITTGRALMISCPSFCKACHGSNRSLKYWNGQK
jgi:hypothetical protein